MRLGFVAGMVAQEKLTPFERLLFRATRGNMFLKSSPVGSVLDPTTSEKQEKAVFVVFFAGDRARSKILKVWSLFAIQLISVGFTIDHVCPLKHSRANLLFNCENWYTQGTAYLASR